MGAQDLLGHWRPTVVGHYHRPYYGGMDRETQPHLSQLGSILLGSPSSALYVLLQPCQFLAPSVAVDVGKERRVWGLATLSARG